MKQLSAICHARQHPAIFWLLILLLLGQSFVVSYLAQPLPVQQSNGQWVTVCTLQGMKKVELAAGDTEQQHYSAYQCPACTLSAALDTSLVSPVIVASLPLATKSKPRPENHSFVNSLLQAFINIRAPPLA